MRNHGRLTPWGLVRYWWGIIYLALTVAGIMLTLVAAADTATAMTILRAVYEPFGRLCSRRQHPVRERRLAAWWVVCVRI